MPRVMESPANMVCAGYPAGMRRRTSNLFGSAIVLSQLTWNKEHRTETCSSRSSRATSSRLPWNRGEKSTGRLEAEPTASVWLGGEAPFI
jgi:hypothetical protein